jgi:hypothetical protein
MSFRAFREKSKWWCLATASVFIVVSSYMRMKFIFEWGNNGGALLLLALISACVTLILGLISLPRWQSFVALAVCCYAVYWSTLPIDAIS